MCACVFVCACVCVCVCVWLWDPLGRALYSVRERECESVCVCIFFVRVCVCVCVCPGKCLGQYEMRESDGFYLLCFETWWSARQMILRISEKLPILLEHLRTDLTQLMGGQRYFLEIRRNESGKLLETIRTVT